MAAPPPTAPSPTDTTPGPAGQEAPPPPSQDPTAKTNATSDPTAGDPGNGAD